MIKAGNSLRIPKYTKFQRNTRKFPENFLKNPDELSLRFTRGMGVSSGSPENDVFPKIFPHGGILTILPCTPLFFCVNQLYTGKSR